MYIAPDTSTVWFTPSDLTSYLASPWILAQRVRAQLGERAWWEKPEDTTASVAGARGEEHEQKYLAALEGRRVASITRAQTAEQWEVAVAETKAALADPEIDVIYQAHLYSECGRWRGQADFIERAPDGSWEPVDTKLARSVKPYMVLQLSIYAAAMAAITGELPREFHVELGDGHRESFVTVDYVDYTRSAQDRLERWYDTGEFREEYPWPTDALADAGLDAEAAEIWERDDHLVQVAWITRQAIERLTEAGIDGMRKLAEADDDARPPKMATKTFENLRRQARLQCSGGLKWELLEPEPKRGFAVMPTRNRGDLFYDIEGDPLFAEDGGLEYLHGIWWKDYSSDDPRAGTFKAIWAHSREEEKEAFEEVIDFFLERRAKAKNMRIYHYAPYEVTALKRLARQYGTREEELDDLLRAEVFVDLFQVVRQGLQASVPAYSIKNMEAFYFDKREGEVTEGGGSIVAYERYRELAGTPEGDQILADIAEYNEDDCLSTYLLREWLWDRRLEAIEKYGYIYEDETPGPISEDRGNVSPMAAEPTKASIRKERQLAMRERLKQRCATTGDPAARSVIDLAAELTLFCRRESKSTWWQVFEHRSMTDRELIDDSIALGGLEPVDPNDDSVERTFTYPPQDSKVRLGNSVEDPVTESRAGKVTAIEAEGEVTIKLSPHAQANPPSSIFPLEYMSTASIEDALLDLAESLDRPAGEPAHFAAVERLLARELPLGGESLECAEIEDLCELLVRLRGSYLVAQGPPGTGKTYTGARLIVDQIRRGHTVGVTAQSHVAVDNLVREVEKAAAEAGVSFRGIKKAKEGRPYESQHGFVESTEDNADVDPDVHQLIAGTAWLFSREELRERLDTLVIDEAGQFSLAFAAAAGTSAETLVLLGDPNQLPQVLQGAHPGGAGASALEHAIGEDRTIAPERGVFLGQTRRLGPEICRFISEMFYESRLTAHEVALDHLPRTGAALDFIPVEHVGNQQCSQEEASIVGADMKHYLAAGIAPEDIMVVTPFNAQVDLIEEELARSVGDDADAIRVLTVDKCQGQECEVVYYSLATSGGEDVPRGLEFLFSANRFNVAISRAKQVAKLVCSPALLETECHRPEQMRLVNAFVHYARTAQR